MRSAQRLPLPSDILYFARQSAIARVSRPRERWLQGSDLPRPYPNPTSSVGAQNGRTSRTLAAFRGPRVFPGEDAISSLWMHRTSRSCDRSSGITWCFAAETNAGVVDKHPRAVRIAGLRLSARPLLVARQALATHAANRHSRIVPPPLAHRLLVTLSGHRRERNYWYPRQPLAWQHARFWPV